MGLRAAVDLACLKARQQVCRFNVHQLHLIGLVEDAIRYPFTHQHAGDGCNQIVEALQVLDIDGRIDVDAAAEQLLDVLKPLLMAAALRVCVGKFVYENQLRRALQGCVQIKVAQKHALVPDFTERQLLQSIDQRHGLRACVGFNVADHHVHAASLRRVRGLQHGIGLAHARRIAKEDLQFSMAALLLLFLLHLPQQCVRIRSVFHAAHLLFH